MQNSNLLRLFEDLLATSTSTQQIELLERIHIELSNITSSVQFEQVHPHVPWSYLFDSLRSNDADELDRLVCSTIEHFVNNLSIEQMMIDFYPLLNKGLDRETALSQRARLLCLRGFERLARCSSNECFYVIQNLFQHNQINALLHLFLDSNEQALWVKSKDILQQMIQNASRIVDQQVFEKYLLEQYFHEINREILLSSNQRNEIVKLRLYEYLIELCLVDPRIYQHITEKQHLLEPFLNDCTHNDDDVLFLMNCLELLTTLTQKPHTLAYLQNKTDVMEHYFRLLSSTDENGLLDLLKPGLIKFFGSYFRNYLLLLEQNVSNHEQDRLLERFLPFLFDILMQSGANTFHFIGLGRTCGSSRSR